VQLPATSVFPGSCPDASCCNASYQSPSNSIYTALMQLPSISCAYACCCPPASSCLRSSAARRAVLCRCVCCCTSCPLFRQLLDCFCLQLHAASCLPAPRRLLRGCLTFQSAPARPCSSSRLPTVTSARVPRTCPARALHTFMSSQCCSVRSYHHIMPSQAKPSQAKPSQAKPSQAKPSQAKPSQAK
jgi:hypothetical protein